jgi:NADH-quinone oxidoreductase subunit F
MSRLPDTASLLSLRDEAQRARQAWPLRITLSGGTCGEAAGTLSVLKALQDRLQDEGLTDEVHVRVTGCQGFCQQEPLLIVEPLGVLYCKVSASDVAEIVSESVIAGRLVERLCFTDEAGRTTQAPANLPFFAKQDR